MSKYICLNCGQTTRNKENGNRNKCKHKEHNWKTVGLGGKGGRSLR